MMVNQVGAGRTELQYRQVKDLPKDVLLMIFDRLREADLARSRRVCRQWNVMGQEDKVTKKFLYAFGARAWYKYFGKVEEPPLPRNIEEILQGPCPFWSGKKVWETHVLTLIPEKVNGKTFTLDSLGEMIGKPKEGYGTKYSNYWVVVKKAHGSQSVTKGYWALMTRDVLPGSRNGPYSEQKGMVEKYRGQGYEVSKLVESATSVLMEHVRTGARLYSDDPWTFTRCQEQVIGDQGVVGGFSSGGLFIITHHHFADESSGVGAVRKF